MTTDTQYCRACKAALPQNAAFCAQCGAEGGSPDLIREQLQQKHETERRQRQTWWLRFVSAVCPCVGALLACLCVVRGDNEDRAEALSLFLATLVGMLFWWIMLKLQLLKWAWLVAGP